MKLKSLGLATYLILMSVFVFAQEQGTASASRKANLRKQFDYRYKGGFYSLEKKFNNTVEYPDYARMNCILGTVVISLKVDCEGIPREIKMKTSLGYGTNEEITKFFESTRGEWNKCDDDKYTRFEIPIQFYIEGTETNKDDAIFICEAEMPGHLCNGDDYYLKRANKALEKGSGKKALKYLNLLLRRDPYNISYADKKQQALDLENKE